MKQIIIYLYEVNGSFYIIGNTRGRTYYYKL